MKNRMANALTSCRIISSLMLLPLPVLSTGFLVIYVIAGVTDLLDGIVARMTNTESAFGAKLDTCADFVLVAVCLIKLIPVLDVPVWFLVWFIILAVIKTMNAITGWFLHKRFLVEHTVLNKVTGLLLFIFPLTLSYIDFEYYAIAACLMATIAAIQEGHLIRKGKEVC